MKHLSPIWFLKSPLDEEYKQYILLDFLQSVSKDLKSKTILSPIKKVYSLINQMVFFRKYSSFDPTDYEDLDESDLKLLKAFSKNPPSKEEMEEIEKIISSSLKVLSQYASMGASLLTRIESRIKIFSLGNEDISNEGGITIFRNMSTDEVYSYWWKKTQITISGAVKKGVVLKSIPILNNKFSLSYEFILHESLDYMGIRNGSKLHCTIIEISEDFNQNSEIFKIAKDKFIQEISQEN